MPVDSANALLRPLGASERFYWLYDQVSCTNFVLLATLDTLLPEERLNAALAVVRQRHPLLQTCIVLDEKRRVRYAPAPDLPITVTGVCGAPAEVWAEAERQLDRPFATDSYPLLRCFVYHHPGQTGTTLLFSFHHAMTDARAAALLIEEMLQEATQPNKTTTPQIHRAYPAQEDLYPDTMRRWRLLGRVLGLLWLQLRWRLGRGVPQQIPHLLEGTGARQTKMLPLELSVDDCARLVERCRQEQTTMQGALCAAQLLAVRGEFPTPQALTLAIASAINMRRLLQPPVADAELGMYTSLVPTRHRLPSNTPFWRLAHQVRTDLTTALNRGMAHLFWAIFPPGWLFPPNQRGAQRLQRLLQLTPPATIVTNLGRIGEQKDTVATLRSLQFAMAPQRGCCLCTAVTSLAGRLQLTCTFNTALLPEERARSLVERIERTLREGIRN